MDYTYSIQTNNTETKMKHITDTFKKFDQLTRDCGCFEDFDDLVNKRHHSYTPSLRVKCNSKRKSDIEQVIKNNRLAEVYDLYMELMGDTRRAYRAG